ncbi:hypothetical protein HaLaN_05651 [Haematococcus lacustris]|uniref:Uncharacterized protein n=1 Tax=Haematococcus lacustris TaxID=44745 RepID=A0A699YJR8_HAELA|nr:hypothetical protein HaLaN_05651 [Haematococcus lacustris]
MAPPANPCRLRSQPAAGDSSSEGSSHGGQADARVPLPLSTGADLQELLEQAAQQYQYRHWGGLGDEAAQLPVGFADLNPAAVSVYMWDDMQDLVAPPSLPSGPHPTPLPPAGPPPLEPAKGLMGQLSQPHAVQASAGDKCQAAGKLAGSSASQGASPGAASATTCSLEDWLGL